jgi:Holliday junction DNA helicase RuvA
MIGRLSGRIAMKGEGQVLLDVQGVGYIVHVADRTLADLPAEGEVAQLWTDLLVREDLLQLFGFATLEEREWHRLLMTVQGIGARASMAILSTLGAEGLARAVALGDWAAVKAAPGIGPKIAQRVVMELKGKAPAMMAFRPAGGPGQAAAAPARPAGPAGGPRAAAGSGRASATAEALSALVNLGYGQGEAAAAVARAAGEAEGADTAELIRLALRGLAPSG